uniref:Conotoxin tx5d n=1 Tax=Conus textile TaxID=6494 RepID=CT5D_CONTE|nr:RecName: Full=Conotoxin tx5d; AltName: Full=Trixin [Conus textile]
NIQIICCKHTPACCT